MRLSGILAGLLIVTASWLCAQKPVGDPAAGRTNTQVISDDGFPLRGMNVEGNHYFKEADILALTDLQIGQLVTPTDFERGLHRINDAGVFEAIEFKYGPKADGYQVSFIVVEGGELYPVRFQGFEKDESEIREMLAEKIALFGEKVPPTGKMVDRIGGALQAYWREMGNDSKITGRMAAIGPDEFEMVFGPESRIDTIAFVKFEGSEAVSTLELQRRFNQVAMGVPYTEPRLKELLHFNVRPIYEGVGRMDVEFCPCGAEPDPNSQGLLVTVQVTDGPAYNFGQIALPANAIVEQDQLRRLIKAESGELVNMIALKDSLAQVEETMGRGGYMKAQADFEATKNVEALTVDIAITLTPGAQYTMGTLTIKGLDIISEPIIRKRWSIARGEAFDAGYAPFFLSRIRDEQMFENLTKTDSRTAIDEIEKIVDVTLIFFGKEAEDKPPDYLPNRPEPF